MEQEQLFLLCLFAIVAVIGYGLCRFVIARDPKLRRRLSNEQLEQRAIRSPAPKPMRSLIQKIGQAASRPFAPKTHEKQSALRRRLSYAGIGSRAAIGAIVGFKVICLFGGLIAGNLIGAAYDNGILGLCAGGSVGYMLPGLWLRTRIGRNHKSLARGLPDALDLMVVCVEAGLTMEAAMQRVGQEITLAHPALARELSIAHLETQMGVPRSEALRNLATRTGSKELKGLTAMLVQSEKLGTSIGKALRVHAESLRLKRQYAAQEMAAKASVKLIFPVAMLIFPATIVVLLGPAIIQMIESGFFNRS
jgi:tight adherence protein C